MTISFNLSLSPASTVSAFTASALIKEESKVRAEMSALNQRLLDIEKRRASMTPLPLDEKDWVKDAEAWSHVSERPPGKLSAVEMSLTNLLGEMSLIARMGARTYSFWFHPTHNNFSQLRVRRTRPEQGGG